MNKKSFVLKRNGATNDFASSLRFVVNDEWKEKLENEQLRSNLIL
jgi:hypothetical protein